MGKISKGATTRTVDLNVQEFVEAAGLGDLRKVCKLFKSGKIEIDDGELDCIASFRTSRIDAPDL